MKKYSLEATIVFCLVVCVVFVVLYLVMFRYGISNDQGDWGTFGDYIGGVVGTVFSFISVILIYLTLKKQTENSILQQFEATFFSLLANQREIVKSMKGYVYVITGEDQGWNTQPEGFEYIDSVSEEVRKSLEKISENRSNPELTREDYESEIQKAYEINYKRKASELGHYFRHLYHVVKYTDESKINNKKKYIDILQAQMSDHELYLTFYNSISIYGKERFLPLLDRYGFFENIISRGKLFNIHKALFFPNTNFKDNSNDSYF